MVKSVGEGRVAHRRGAALSADGDLLVLDDAEYSDWHGASPTQVVGSSLTRPSSSITEDSHPLEIPKLRTRVRFPSPAPSPALGLMLSQRLGKSLQALTTRWTNLQHEVAVTTS